MLQTQSKNGSNLSKKMGEQIAQMFIWCSRKIQFQIQFFQLNLFDNVLIQAFECTISKNNQLDLNMKQTTGKQYFKKLGGIEPTT